MEELAIFGVAELLAAIPGLAPPPKKKEEETAPVTLSI
jgi:hypothetical protein